MKIFALLALTAVVNGNFTCIKPVNPIPAGPPGVCCEELNQNALLAFVYTGNTCKSFPLFANLINPNKVVSEEDAGRANSSYKVHGQIQSMKPMMERRHILPVRMGNEQLVVIRYVYLL